MPITRKLIFDHKEQAELFIDCLQAEHVRHGHVLPTVKVELSLRRGWVITFEIVNQYCRDVELWLSGLNTGMVLNDVKVSTGNSHSLSPLDSTAHLQLVEQLLQNGF